MAPGPSQFPAQPREETPPVYDYDDDDDYGPLTDGDPCPVEDCDGELGEAESYPDHRGNTVVYLTCSDCKFERPIGRSGVL